MTETLSAWHVLSASTSPLNAVVLTTARQGQWLRHCQLDMCSPRQHGAQPTRSFLRTVSSDSLQIWAHRWAYSTLLSSLNAVVLTTARQEQWLRHCQLDMCSQLQHGAQPTRSFLRTVSNDSLHRWAPNFTKLNIDVSIECCSADYG